MNKKQSDKIFVLGDIHADWNLLNHFIEVKQPNIILSTGDFGFWPRFSQYEIDIKNDYTKIYWCPGNHEDWDEIDKIKNYEIKPNIFYMKFGSILKLSDGRNILFCGGADSIDKGWRTIGHNWFRQEIITNNDMDQLPNENIDIVISHTCPREFLEYLSDFKYKEKVNDPSCHALSIVLEKYKPNLIMAEM